MATPIILLVFNILVFVVAMIVMIYVFPFRKLQSIRWLMILVGSFCLISFCALGVYTADDIESKIFFSRMRFLTLGFLAPSWLMFISAVYGQWTWLHKKWITILIVLPACITTLLTISPHYHDLILTKFAPITLNHFSVVKFETGAWFSAHYLLAMTLILLSIIMGHFLFFKEKGIRRRQVVILVACSTLAAGVDIYCVLTNSPYRWLMLSSGTYLFSLLGIFYSTHRLKLLNVVPLAMTQVFNNFPDPVIVVDGDQRIRTLNKAAMLFFGLKNSTGKIFNEVLGDVKLIDGEISLTDRAGEKHFFNLTIEKLETDSELTSGMIVFFRLITVQKSIERRLNEKLEFKARLLALVAHDLSGHIENQAVLSLAIQDDIEDGPIRERVELLAHSAVVSQGFVDNIMSWVKGQGTHFELVRKSFEWNFLIKDCINELETPCSLKKITINFNSTVALLLGEGDSEMLSSVVRNILSNSIRASHEGNKIEIYLHASDDKAEVTVIDEGAGMTPDLLKMINEAPDDFSFQDINDTKFKSFGVGLMIVKNFIKLHHGLLSIESESGAGTRVSFYIPLR